MKATTLLRAGALQGVPQGEKTTKHKIQKPRKRTRPTLESGVQKGIFIDPHLAFTEVSLQGQNPSFQEVKSK